MFPSIIMILQAVKLEWDESGGSRLALSGRVIEVTMRNPITGLGPAAYRFYARMTTVGLSGSLLG